MALSEGGRTLYGMSYMYHHLKIYIMCLQAVNNILVVLSRGRTYSKWNVLYVPPSENSTCEMNAYSIVEISMVSCSCLNLLFLLQLTILSRPVIAVKSKFLVAFLCCPLVF